MNNTYEIMDYVREAHRVDQKLAKINQQKLGSVKEKYNIKWKTLAAAVKAPVASNPTNNVLPFPNVQTEVASTEVNNMGINSNVVPFSASAQANNVTSTNENTTTSGVVDNITSIDAVKNKHDRVSKNFNITVYNKNYQISTLCLNGARKIRTRQDTKNKTNDYSNKMGTEIFGDVLIPVTVENASSVNDNIATAIQTPSVDDYLQKEKVNNENARVAQLESDIEAVKRQVDEAKAYLEKLDKKYTNVMNYKTQIRINELEKDKLEYTNVLNDIVRQVKEREAQLRNAEQEVPGYSNEVSFPSYGEQETQKSSLVA